MLVLADTENVMDFATWAFITMYMHGDLSPESFLSKVRSLFEKIKRDEMVLLTKGLGLLKSYNVVAIFGGKPSDGIMAPRQVRESELVVIEYQSSRD